VERNPERARGGKISRNWEGKQAAKGGKNEKGGQFIN
jgi:hypothetical protein